jgi:metallophosphoesterase superfamily enzyme
VAGHLHPGARLAGPGGQRETLPCFYFGHRYGILPAFGDFTGTALVRPKRGHRLYVLAGDEIIAPTFR